MRTLILDWIMLFPFFGCKAQGKIVSKYIGYQYKETNNNSFIKRELLFLEKNDTLRINIRLPFDTKNPQIINPGIYYNCHLKVDTVYTISLKKICAGDIPDVYNSYYKTNTIPDKNDCSKFTEVVNNTPYEYKGHYGEYVDINGGLYEITGLSPGDGCSFSN